MEKRMVKMLRKMFCFPAILPLLAEIQTTFGRSALLLNNVVVDPICSIPKKSVIKFHVFYYLQLFAVYCGEYSKKLDAAKSQIQIS